jgi:hypothetical protein
MNCFRHDGAAAIGICKSCGRGLCRDCFEAYPEVDPGKPPTPGSAPSRAARSVLYCKGECVQGARRSLDEWQHEIDDETRLKRTRVWFAAGMCVVGVSLGTAGLSLPGGDIFGWFIVLAGALITAFALHLLRLSIRDIARRS